jgi:polyisoprenoid-binding protein YceI
MTYRAALRWTSQADQRTTHDPRDPRNQDSHPAHPTDRPPDRLDDRPGPHRRPLLRQAHDGHDRPWQVPRCGGTLHLDEADPVRSSAEIRVAAASLSTGSAPRDGHLRSADFFNADVHPAIVFRSTSIDQVGTNDFQIRGDLTIQETTRPIVFDATFLGFYTGMQGTRRVGLSARTIINRKDWGLGWNVALETGGWLVGENVTLEIEIAADEAAPAAAGADTQTGTAA